MIEILALIFLTRNIGNLAVQKGLKSGTWKLYMVLAWFGAEIVGILIGLALLGTENVIGAVLFGLAAAISSYFILKSTLEKKPDIFEDDINELGQPQQ
jgi:hypothetical protein